MRCTRVCELFKCFQYGPENFESDGLLNVEKCEILRVPLCAKNIESIFVSYMKSVALPMDNPGEEKKVLERSERPRQQEAEGSTGPSVGQAYGSRGAQRRRYKGRSGHLRTGGK
ncbi:hypothetical protein AVEN_229547-1 [Araneus ventricosus]|uniref:Uncharacterized protein n=1 Tax=Araneus ventricosus TaxID=182803 RepID=A0A4Y2EJG1_ARAVE|nr:hypothetical protein AVEN_229547-1 [Araneus ventricosus]